MRLLILAVLLAGCGTSSQYVEADRATYNAISTSYLSYVDRDPALSAEQRALRHATVKSWRKRIEAAERNLGSTGGR